MGRGRQAAIRAAEGVGRTTRIIPELVGLTVGDALLLAGTVGLVLITPDPDGPPLETVAATTPSRIVWQLPKPGGACQLRDPILVGYEPGDDGGTHVDDPWRPLPDAFPTAMM